MKKVPFFKKTIAPSHLEKISVAISSGHLTYGATTQALENEFKNKFNFKEVIATNSATSALHLALLGLDIKRGDKVVVPTNTYNATAMACHYVGAEVVFCDIELDNYNLCPKALREILVSNEIRAVIMVHLAGRVSSVSAINELKNEYKFFLIEDCAHAFYSKSNNAFVGAHNNLSDMSVFSFHPNKVLGSVEGGLLVSANPALSKKLKLLKNSGINRDFKDPEAGYATWLYDVESLGYKYAMNNVCATLVLEELKNLEDEYQQRKKIVTHYLESFKNISDIKMLDYDFKIHNENFHLFIIRTPKRNELAKFLENKEIECSLHYRPLHLHSYWKKEGEVNLPKAEIYYREALSLPLYPGLSFEDQNYVIDSVKEFFN